MTALVLKFVQLCKQNSSPVDKELTARDIITAEERWIRSVQETAFASELESLKKPHSQLNS